MLENNESDSGKDMDFKSVETSAQSESGPTNGSAKDEVNSSDETRSVDQHHQPDSLPLEESQLDAMPVVVSEESDESKEEDHSESFDHLGKEEMLGLLEELIGAEEIAAGKNKIFSLKDAFTKLIDQEKQEVLHKFIEAGGVKDDFKATPDPVDEKFHKLIRRFNQRRIEFRVKQERDRQENLRLKLEILQQFKNLIQYEEDMKKAFNDFHELQNKWRDIGPVPAMNANDLWMTYKLYIDKFYELIKINRDLQDLDQKKNLALKMQLCEKAEELILEPSIQKSLGKLQEIQNKWREIGLVPRDQKVELWERLKAATDKLYERREQFFNEQKEKQQKCFELKNELVQKAESYSNRNSEIFKEWGEWTREIFALQDEWKKAGYAGKEENEKLWQRFKESCDGFFRNKSEFFGRQRDEWNKNLQIKTELCITAEALKDSTDWKNTTAEFIRIQQQWKKTGTVGNKNSDKIWKRFKAACDVFFENKQHHYATIDQQYDDNFLRKQQLLEEIEKFELAEDNHQNLEQIKNFQRQWSEIGLVPMPKKEELQTRYRKAIDTHFNNLKIEESEKNKIRFNQKIETLKASPGGKGKLDDERRFLLNKVSSLKNDVALWENNIGFFAKSKNADALKLEFEKKINDAKKEIQELSGKIEILKKN